jgi:hypothetical protein
MSSFIGSQSLGKLSDISNVSFGDNSTMPPDMITDEGSIATKVKSQPEDFGVDSRIVSAQMFFLFLLVLLSSRMRIGSCFGFFNFHHLFEEKKIETRI